MNLTFEDKVAIFKMAKDSALERPISQEEIIAVEKIFDSCSNQEQEKLIHYASVVCGEIAVMKNSRRLGYC